MTNEIKLGVKAKDKITGFEGIVGGRAKYLFGCDTILLLPKCKEGSFNEGHWFDEPRIECIGKGISPSEVSGEDPGSDKQAPKK